LRRIGAGQSRRRRRCAGRRTWPLFLADDHVAAARGRRLQEGRGRGVSSEADGRRRVVIESVRPEVDCGRFPAKRVVGDLVVVEADVFTDGHDRIACRLKYRGPGEAEWRETPMEPLANDRWRGRFQVDTLGRYEYTVAAW